MVQVVKLFQMEINTKATIKMVILKERENINGKIEQSFKVNLNKDIGKEKVLLQQKTIQFLWEILLEICQMDKAHYNTKMEISTLEISQKDRKMDLEHLT